MEIGGFIFWGGVVLIIGYLIVIYNNLVRIKHNVTKAWSNIDVLLKQRHDELPKLVEVCKQYANFEQETLEKVMQARSAVSAAREQGDVAALGPAETQLRLGLGNLFAVAEAYPELKANESYQHLQSRISGLEGAIADRREFYNESVNINNIRIEQFPDLFIARMFGFDERKMLRFSEEEKRDVNIKQLFDS
ncbi:MAG: LemA family protein [Gammaproteobacteria bacterium]|nr:LemA family protein [Gammaproteobacteria bacterium]